MKKQRRKSIRQEVRSKGGFIIPGPESRVLYYDTDTDEVQDWGPLLGYQVYPEYVLPISEQNGAVVWPEAWFALEMPNGRVHLLQSRKHETGAGRTYASRHVWHGYIRTDYILVK